MELETTTQKPNVFEYSDFRDFLGALYKHYKVRDEKFSFRFFARRAGFKSPNFLKLVIDGKRNLSEESAQKLGEAFRLTRKEVEFLLKLIRFNQAKNSIEKAEQAEELMRSRGFQHIRPLTQAQFSYYAKWYYIPIREMVALKDFREDHEWIANQLLPAIKPEQVEEAIRDLLKIGLLERNNDGLLAQVELTVTTPNEVSSSSIVKYHLEMMRKAGDSLSMIRGPRREISSACIPVSEEIMLKIKQKIQNFRDEILAIATQDSGAQSVYQLNFQFFPLTGADNLKEGKK